MDARERDRPMVTSATGAGLHEARHHGAIAICFYVNHELSDDKRYQRIFHVCRLQSPTQRRFRLPDAMNFL